MQRLDPYLVPVAAATVALPWIVPGFPLAHLDDPGHWGVIGYLVVLAIVLRLRLRGARGTRAERRVLAIFLAGMPVVYLADWVRFDGPPPWLWIEAAGAVPFWALAVLGLRRWPGFLVAGLAGHALWDAAHYRRTDFVADWYVVGCLLVDLAFAVYAAGQVRFWRERAAGIEANPAALGT